MPLADDDDEDDDECGPGTLQPVALVVPTTPPVHVPDAPSTILAPASHLPAPHPSHSQLPHATLPVSHRSHTSAILGIVVGIVIALVAFFFTAHHVRRRRIIVDPFKDPPKPRFTVFRLRNSTPKKRLSDESWVSPAIPEFGSPESLRRYALPQRKLVPITTPVCTPTDTEFGSCLAFANSNPGLVISVPPVRVPSPVYISPFSPSPSLSSSSSLSPAPSVILLSSSSPNPARLSRLLSSTFRDTRVITSPTRPTTAHLVQTARSYAHAYRPSSATTTSLYTPPTPITRLAGTQSRASFYSGQTDDGHTGWDRVRDTFSTVTTSDTDTVCTVPHLLRAVAQVQPSASPFADPDIRDENEQPASASTAGQPTRTEGPGRAQTPMGTPLGLKLRLSDASEHARYRLRERERERERQQSREGESARQRSESRLSTDSRTSESMVTSVETLRAGQMHQLSQSFEAEVEVEEMRKLFKLRDSESVLREIGW